MFYENEAIIRIAEIGNHDDIWKQKRKYIQE